MQRVSIQRTWECGAGSADIPKAITFLFFLLKGPGEVCLCLKILYEFMFLELKPPAGTYNMIYSKSLLNLPLQKNTHSMITLN